MTCDAVDRTVLLPGFILFLFLTITGSGCGAFRFGETVAFEIHLQGGFYDDDVTVSVDHDVVYRARTSTENLVGLAKRLLLDIERGPHVIGVRVASGPEAVEVIVLESALYLGVSYDRENNRLKFQTSEDGFVYF